jgi:hypothetical protein
VKGCTFRLDFLRQTFARACQGCGLRPLARLREGIGDWLMIGITIMFVAVDVPADRDICDGPVIAIGSG